MAVSNKKAAARLRRKRSIRKRLSGTTDRPRLSVFRSNKHIYAQVIDDTTGQTIASASTLCEDVRGQLEDGQKKSAAAHVVGQVLARRCLDKQVEAVVFDRNGFIYHGRVKAVAEGAREGGLRF